MPKKDNDKKGKGCRVVNACKTGTFGKSKILKICSYLLILLPCVYIVHTFTIPFSLSLTQLPVSVCGMSHDDEE